MAPPRSSWPWRREEPGLTRAGAAGQPRQGGRGAGGTACGPGAGLHARADHGLRRPAPGRLHRARSWLRRSDAPAAMVLGRPVFDASAPRACGSRDARFPTGGPISKRCGSASTIRCSVFASTRSRRSCRSWAPVMDAPIRFRRRSGGAPVLAGRRPVNLPATGALLSRRRRRRVAFQVLARQPTAHVDARRLFIGFLARLPVLLCAACGRRRARSRGARFARAISEKIPSSTWRVRSREARATRMAAMICAGAAQASIVSQ